MEQQKLIDINRAQQEALLNNPKYKDYILTERLKDYEWYSDQMVIRTQNPLNNRTRIEIPKDLQPIGTKIQYKEIDDLIVTIISIILSTPIDMCYLYHSHSSYYRIVLRGPDVYNNSKLKQTRFDSKDNRISLFDLIIFLEMLDVSKLGRYLH